MNTKTWFGKVEVVAEHATHEGFRSVRWRRTGGYSEPGIDPAAMWIPASFGVRVGDSVKVTVEFTGEQS